MSGIVFYPVLFGAGAVGYGLLEVAFRGKTHWTMLAAGGICLVTIYELCRCMHLSRWKKCIMGGAVITAVEFLFGVAVNLLLRWNVWDYSARPGNLLGQICPLFTALWVLLCLPVTIGCDFVIKRRS